MLNHYEAAFVLTPVLSEPQMKEAVDKFENLLKENGGSILNREEWGLKKLAYPIQGKTTGFYALLQFDVEPEVIANSRQHSVVTSACCVSSLHVLTSTLTSTLKSVVTQMLNHKNKRRHNHGTE